MPWLLPYKSFIIHYSLVFLSFDARYCELLSVLLNKPQIEPTNVIFPETYKKSSRAMFFFKEVKYKFVSEV